MKELIIKIKEKIENQTFFNNLNKINNNLSYENFVFNEEGKSISIKKENFLNIEDIKSEYNGNILKKKIAFVDGGFCEVIKANAIAVYFYRIYYTIYQYNKRVENKFFEFYCYVHPEFIAEKELIKKDNNLLNNFSEKKNFFYKCDIFFVNKNKKLQERDNNNLDNKIDDKKKFENNIAEDNLFYDIDLKFDAFDKSISVNNKYADVSVIGNIIRRFAELNVIKKIDSDYVVLDGSLDINYPYEKEIFVSLINHCLEKNKVIIGLSKTNNFITKEGMPLNYYLLNISKKLEKDVFVYYLDKNDLSNILFVKLNEKSDYVFRMDLLSELLKNNNIKNNNNYEKINEIFFLLKENSKDPIFLGYPYGLIEADMFARISNKEKEQLTLRFFSDFGKAGIELKKLLLMNKTHDILDSIRF